MATPLSAARLVAALKDEGVKIVEYKSWRTNNRNSVGSWGPVHGVMLHHTVTSGTDGSVELCYSGRSDLPGPLCHGVIAKNGTCYLVGNGRANHAGSGDRDVLDAVIAERPLPPDRNANTDGNTHFYGFECINLGDGKDPWPAAQVDAMVRASAAILRAHNWGRSGDTSVIGHLEWQPGKIDPRPSPGGADVAMPALRKRVAERLKHPPSWNGDDDMPTPKDLWTYKIAYNDQNLAAESLLRRAYDNALRAREAAEKAVALAGAQGALLEKVSEGAGLSADDAKSVAEEGARAALTKLREEEASAAEPE